MYPFVDIEKCINCGLCERVCPIINQGKPRSPLKVFAAKNKNEEIRLKSSSGGIFTLLAESIIQEGGVVFGARFDESWNVIHDYTEAIEGLEAFRGSKYVQSRIGKSFQQVESFLKTGRKVMFTGTPCQVAGLKKYLRKEYENLLTVDFVCHGVPSPLVWQEYLNKVICSKKEFSGNTDLLFDKRAPEITGISFRDKLNGWKKFGFVVYAKCSSEKDINKGLSTESRVLLHEPFYENVFMKGFLCDIFLRPSCYACPAKSGKSGADITLGDFWGIENHFPKFDDDKGISLVMIQTQKGQSFFTSMENGSFFEVSYGEALAGNLAIERSAKCASKYRSLFWESEDKVTNILRVISKMKPGITRRCVDFIKRKIRNTFS